MSTEFPTRRAIAPALEAILNQELRVLDHGFLRVIDYMGNDSSIVQAARVSYGTGTKTVREDRGLIKYLMRNHHTSPFEMCEIKLHVKLPIFVARQWIRHRTASVNEYSARYSVLDKEFYFPSPDNISAQSAANMQGRDTAPVSPERASHVLETMRDDAQRNYQHYLEFLNVSDGEENEDGISRELARINLTLNTYTQWYWKIDLHNLFGFLQLRTDLHAQYEIREYARQILSIVKLWVPIACEAFEEYRQESLTLSQKEVSVLRALFAGKNISEVRALVSEKDWAKLVDLFGIG